MKTPKVDPTEKKTSDKIKNIMFQIDLSFHMENVFK